MWRDKTGQSSNEDVGNVLRLGHQPGPSRQISVLMALEEYWRGLGRMGDIPDRHDVEPRDIGPCLRHCYIASIIAPGLARIRFAGQELEQIFGMDVRGMPMSALFDPGSRVRLHDALERIAAAPTIVELPLETGQRVLRRRLAGRMSLLPLRDGAGAVTHILGAVIFDGKTATRGPAQITIPTDRAFRVERLHIAQPPRVGSDKPTLRLVVDNS
ncbi:PAS domain-containing protein [Ponticoccus sp. SC2-23]|uniref:PAS domain-containing protein n=1 Tax=Alexandriicola marinus TaxID=2081710 RepID=UPI000FD9F988|nr:PAS domain-containing protein [Alexandriicola marinus]MBM1218848.1 PAS domain-containing protein [Ponticoccus sp. SC6-9]MBM1224080.1 PAS domain-containing protein [Ponticoccus sp. SC6-15]MBM1230141.1 PAS domain-containing protein [Ponticoccus sp. SC6-38]MBM1233046.1 PAS domain-containing protein [Ponticoccus sp. SC6-45]MBM1237004.1 PAS domain-containing protein [Ponticoccus sp. SC6-49]MBM1242057.1 PAS domain-containing protein [Ponticoccus sp. SC2-64]MBM1246570.1 PAS domain-containing pro